MITKFAEVISNCNDCIIEVIVTTLIDIARYYQTQESRNQEAVARVPQHWTIGDTVPSFNNMD